MTNNANLGAIAVSPAATTQAGNGLFNNPGVFKKYAEPAKAHTAVAAAASAVTTPAPINNTGVLLSIGEQLLASYQELKHTLFDRTDRALWQLLSDVYDYVLTIEASSDPKVVKKALRKAIEAREGEVLSTGAKTEVVVVRYLFADAARQTRNNYSTVMHKAQAIGKTYGELITLLEEHNGVAHVVAKDFNEDSKPVKSKEELKAERVEKVTLVRRLLSAKPHCGYSAELTGAKVEDYNLTAAEVADLKGAKKSEPKNQRGDYVFFVAVPGASVDEYTVVHGFKAARDFEERMFLEIAKGMKAELTALKEVVHGFETAACEALSEQ